MKNITNDAAMNLAHELRADGQLFWSIGAKLFLMLPYEAVSVKNKLELNRALREYRYLGRHQCLDGTALDCFRMEADEIAYDGEVWLDQFGTSIAQAQLERVRHDIAGMKALIKNYIGNMSQEDYLARMEATTN